MRKIEVTTSENGKIRVLFVEEDILDGKILSLSEAQALWTKLGETLSSIAAEE